MITKLQRYPHQKPVICPYCLFNLSIGRTSDGALGCRFCQEKVDDYILANYNVSEEEYGS